MNKAGYLITSTITPKTYFTSSSAYDRPSWVGINEATKYVTADIAELALKKLIKHGVYQCRLMSLQEAMDFEFPEKTARDEPTNIKAPIDGERDEMVAQDQESVCQSCDHEPCTCEHNDDSEQGDNPDQPSDLDQLATPDSRDPALDDLDGIEDEEAAGTGNRFAPGQTVSYKGSEFVVVGDSGVGVTSIAPLDNPEQIQQVGNADLRLVHESVEGLAAAIMEAEEVKVTKVAYKDDSRSAAPVDFGGDADDVKVAVPADVKSALSSAIAEYTKTAEEQNGRDDARSSFAMTCASAMQELADLLNQGTIAGMKQAQIKLTTLMNPITSNIPSVVLKFIHMGGRKPSLKDLFDDKRESKKIMSEATQDDHDKMAKEYDKDLDRESRQPKFAVVIKHDSGTKTEYIKADNKEAAREKATNHCLKGLKNAKVTNVTEIR